MPAGCSTMKPIWPVVCLSFSMQTSQTATSLANAQARREPGAHGPTSVCWRVMPLQCLTQLSCIVYTSCLEVAHTRLRSCRAAISCSEQGLRLPTVAETTPSKAAMAAAERGPRPRTQQAAEKGPSSCSRHWMQVELLLKVPGEAWEAQEAPDMGNHTVRGAMQAARSRLWPGSTRSDHF